MLAVAATTTFQTQRPATPAGLRHEHERVVGAARPVRHRTFAIATALAIFGSVVAALSSHPETSLYLLAVAAVAVVGWRAAAIETWSFSDGAVSQRRVLTTTSIRYANITEVSVADAADVDGHGEIRFSGPGWFSVDVPSRVWTDNPMMATALRNAVDAAREHGATVSADVATVLA
jgi:hypothetical protein